MRNPFISVIITVYNKQEFIKDTIKSVLSQTYQDYEILIIDDGSTDNSLAEIKTFDDSRIRIFTQTNIGVSAARNLGIANSVGQFIALLDGDDLWKPNYLKTIIKYIDKYNHQSVFGTAIAHLYNNKTSAVSYGFEHSSDVAILDYFSNSLRHQILLSSSMVFRKSILDDVGNYDETLNTGEDIDFNIRIGSRHPVVFINKVLVMYRYCETSLSNTNFDLAGKPKFDRYYHLEKNRAGMKKYIDQNRYSLAILSKLNKDPESFNFYRKNISLKSLNPKRRFLLSSPAWLLHLLLDIKALKGKKLYYRPLNSRKSS